MWSPVPPGESICSSSTPFPLGSIPFPFALTLPAISWLFRLGTALCNIQRALLSHTACCYARQWNKPFAFAFAYCVCTLSGITHNKILLHIFALVAEPAKIRLQLALPCQALRREGQLAAVLVLPVQLCLLGGWLLVSWPINSCCTCTTYKYLINL